MIGFIAVAVVMIVGTVALLAVPLYRNREARAPLAALVVAVGVPAAAALLYASLTSYPWGRTAPPSAESPVTDSQEILQLQRAIEERPDDVASWVALGQRYMIDERFADARNAFTRAAELEPQNSEAQLGAAEAAILLDRNALAAEAGQVIEQVLAAQPDNPKALWYGGMAALTRGAQGIARDRWQRLLALSPPEAVRQIIEAELARLGGDGSSESRPADSNMRLAVRVSVAPALAGRVKAGAPVFLIARDPDRAGPPVAVVRREAATLPSTLEITDADMMLPGQTLSELAQVRLTARVANGGEARAVSGDVFGEALWTRDSAAPLEITMDSVVP
jgi:cytochrome c-type biogenesis protein CcmH